MLRLIGVGVSMGPLTPPPRAFSGKFCLHLGAFRVGYAARRVRRRLPDWLYARLTPPYGKRFGETQPP